ncbi:pyridoxamine 5'-phosphate oxidase family protein [Methanosarcina sp. DH2]|nr:pyridoxamine 5'-phosphate oxidase family protein [Methanosarcina sp. DH2]
MTVKDEIASVIPHEPEEGVGETFVEKIGLEKEECLGRLRKFFESQPLAVLATQNGTAPYLSLVAFASNERLTYILFSTTRATRKYSNLMANPEVSLLIDNRKNKIEDFRDAMAVTALGRVEPVEDFELSIMKKIYLMKHPYLEDFLHSPTTAFLKIRIEKYIVVTRFQHVVEVSV